MPSFSQKQVILVCGKGGVGKTTIASALALQEARAGRRTLLVGIHSTDQMKQYFGVSTVGIEELQLDENLFGIHLDEQLVFDSFIRQSFRLKTIYQRILDSNVYQYFTAAAPGFKELIVLDTIQHFAGRRKRPYERVLIDCPATGHGLSYLRVGQQAMKSFSIGPLRKKAEAVHRLLSDHGRTGVLLVTLAEEMPVNETLELWSALRDDLGVSIEAVVANGLLDPAAASLSEDALLRLQEAASFFVVPGVARSLAQTALFYSARAKINLFHLNRLREKISLPLIQVPFLPNESRDLEFLLEVSGYLGGERG